MSPIPTPPAGWRDAADRAVARGRRVDRFLPFLDSRFSRAGYVYGTAVGWIWGSLWSTGRVEKRAGLWVFRGMPRWAFRRGGVCVGGCFLTGDDAVSDRVLAPRSRARAAVAAATASSCRCCTCSPGRDPLRNRFEIEAGLEDGNYVPRAQLSAEGRDTSSARDLSSATDRARTVMRAAPSSGAPVSARSRARSARACGSRRQRRRCGP